MEWIILDKKIQQTKTEIIKDTKTQVCNTEIIQVIVISSNIISIVSWIIINSQSSSILLVLNPTKFCFLSLLSRLLDRNLTSIFSDEFITFAFDVAIEYGIIFHVALRLLPLNSNWIQYRTFTNEKEILINFYFRKSKQKIDINEHCVIKFLVMDLNF
jgi:hypothetical protein